MPDGGVGERLKPAGLKHSLLSRPACFPNAPGDPSAYLTCFGRESTCQTRLNWISTRSQQIGPISVGSAIGGKSKDTSTAEKAFAASRTLGRVLSFTQFSAVRQCKNNERGNRNIDVLLHTCEHHRFTGELALLSDASFRSRGELLSKLSLGGSKKTSVPVSTLEAIRRTSSSEFQPGRAI
jgi:hypothetical protein